VVDTIRISRATNNDLACTDLRLRNVCHHADDTRASWWIGGGGLMSCCGGASNPSRDVVDTDGTSGRARGVAKRGVR
jgi:hypothetical protein